MGVENGSFPESSVRIPTHKVILLVVMACSNWASYVTLLKCSNWRPTSLDECIHERHHVASWLSPGRDPESRMLKGCVLHSPPNKGAMCLVLNMGNIRVS
jgi:hypothetical protein